MIDRMIDTGPIEAVVRQAGQLAMASWPGAGHALDVWEKAPGDPVSAADLAVDAFLRRELGSIMPEAGWLSEETTDKGERVSRDFLWLVDPIDGTRDYIRGRSGWAVSVALVKAGRPVLAWLCAPARGELWHARKGGGSWRNGRRLQASARQILAGARVPAQTLAPEDKDLTMVDQPNSIALRMGLVGASDADLVATLRWGFEWDIGAAALIASEAGAVVTDALGQPFLFNKPDPRAFGVLATAPAIHDQALARLAERAQRRLEDS